MEEGRDTVLAGIGVTWQAVSGSRSSETECLLLADVGICRRGTDDPVDAECGVTTLTAAGTGCRS